MDVRCDRCQTEYELDEMRLTASGVAVKCTNCGNVFKVRRSLGDDVVPAKQKVREWHVRRQDGTTLTLRELTELQKAVVERKVSPEDSVSLSGESWHQLGAMPELASFFEVVQAANRAQAPQRPSPAPQRAPVPPPAQRAPMPPAPKVVAPAPAQQTSPAPVQQPVQQSSDSGIRRSLTPIWGEGPQSFGPAPISSEPAWAADSQRVDPELTELLEKEDLQAVKGGHGGLWIALVVILLAGGGAAGYFFFLHAGGFGPAPAAAGINGAPPVGSQPDALAPPAIAPVKPPVPKPQEPKPAEVKPPPAEVANAAKPSGAGGVPPVAPASAGAVGVSAAHEPPAKIATNVAAAETPKPVAKAPAKAEKAESEGGSRSFDYYISQGHRLLDSKPTEALALFHKAAEADPSSPEPDSGRGLAYANMDRLGDAAAAFQAALKKSPEFTEAIMGLAEISREQGNTRKAIGLYQRYLDLTPDGTDAPAARAQLEELKSAAAAQAPAPKAVVATPVAAEPPPVTAPAPQAATNTVPPPPPVVVPDSQPSPSPSAP